MSVVLLFPVPFLANIAVSLAVITAITGRSGAVLNDPPPVRAGEVVEAPLPWPQRVALKPGLNPETIAALPPGTRLMGSIERCTDLLQPRHLSSWPSEGVEAEQKRDWELALGRLVEPAQLLPQFESDGSYLFVESKDARPRPGVSGPAFAFRFISIRLPRLLGGEERSVIERTWFSFYDPLPPKSPPGTPASATPQAPRGLVVFMPGMFGTPDEQVVALIRRLRQEGYGVLRMLSQPSRFTMKGVYSMPLEGDLPIDLVSQMADELTDRAAEAAYAVQAAAVYVKQERPAYAALPRIAVGFSGGAMLLPIVMAREPDAYAGAVSVAGGVDYLRIMATSNYANWIGAVRLNWTAEKTPQASTALGGDPPEPLRPSPSRLDQLSRLYRSKAPLDSANLAPRLARIPWLMLHASSDRAVPAATGEEMWELLGKPQRTIVSGGHEWIFISLAVRYNSIANWLNALAPLPVDSVPAP